VGIKFANQAAGTLASAITSGATTITLTAGHGARFPALVNRGDYFLATLANASGYEIVLCVARAGDVLTVFRGQEGTAPMAFNAGDLCDNRMTAGTMLDLSSVATGSKNKVRNGKMLIKQRGSTFAAAGNGYCFDGWRLDKAGTASVTISDPGSVATYDFQSGLMVTVNTAQAVLGANDFGVLWQPIEGYLVRDLIGNPIAISFEVSTSKPGTYGVAIRNRGSGTPDRSYVCNYTVNAANTGQVVTVPIPVGLTQAGSWNFTNGVGLDILFCLAAGTSKQGASYGSWLTGDFFAGPGQVNVFDTVNAYWAVTGVQLERNLVASQFEHLDPVLEMMRNLRYFERRSVGVSGISNERMTTTGFANGSGTAQFPIQHLVVKRAPPSSVTFNNVSGLSVYDGAGVTNVSSLALDNAGLFVTNVTASLSGMTLGRACHLTWNNTAGVFPSIDISSEL
jgi:hypothetical protein